MLPPAPVPSLLIKRLSDKATLPTRGSSQSAGYDLYRYVAARSTRFDAFFCRCFAYSTRSAENKVVPAKGKALVDIQISIAVPPGTYGRVAPRSGLGMSHLQRD